MLDQGRAYLRLPRVEDTAALIRVLDTHGIAAALAEPPAALDVKAIRDRTGLTQEQFALRFRIELDALRNWESRRRTPEPMARCLLHMIAMDPAFVEEALSAVPPG
jgi:DNA-binding transcriptional regulator YiaG